MNPAHDPRAKGTYSGNMAAKYCPVRVYQSPLAALPAHLPVSGHQQQAPRIGNMPGDAATHPAAARPPQPSPAKPGHSEASDDGRYRIIGQFQLVCCVAASTTQKKAQPRRIALKFHQRRRFWRMCADVCRDTQHGSHFATAIRGVKRFLLLRNINFIVGSMRITKPNQAIVSQP